MRNRFQAEIESVDNKTAVINLIGDLTSLADQPIHDAFDAVSADGFQNIIFNFTPDYAICSPGISTLLRVMAEAQKNDQNLLMAVPSRHFQKIFHMMGITKHVAVVDSLEEAKQRTL